MSKPIYYQQGSLIYYQGDKADKVFLLQDGKVSLTYKDIEKGSDVRDQVQVGEFFGARSALGRHPREENAIAMAENTAVTVFTVTEFESFVTENPRIAMKMLKVFSTQMRKIHKQESSLMEKADVEPGEGLYNIGEYYLKNRRFIYAKYVFNSYLTYYPSGKNAASAVKNLEIAESFLNQHGDGHGPNPGHGSAETAKGVPVAAAKTGASEAEYTKTYLDAINMIFRGKYQEAFNSLKSIVAADKKSELAAKSSFEMGRCIFLLRKYEECIKYYTALLVEQPRHSALADIMFIMGQCNERVGRKEKAAAFYKKILSMNPDHSNENIIKAKKALDALGA